MPVVGSFLADAVGVNCTEEVIEATAWIEAYFPRFEGVSGGSAQLIFLQRDGVAYLWAVY